MMLAHCAANKLPGRRKDVVTSQAGSHYVR